MFSIDCQSSKVGAQVDSTIFHDHSTIMSDYRRVRMPQQRHNQNEPIRYLGLSEGINPAPFIYSLIHSHIIERNQEKTRNYSGEREDEMSQGLNNREVPLMYSGSNSIYGDQTPLLHTQVVTQQPALFTQDKLYKPS